MGCLPLYFRRTAYFHSLVYYKAVSDSYLQQGIQIDSLVVRDMPKAFPELRNPVLRDEDELRRGVLICSRQQLVPRSEDLATH